MGTGLFDDDKPLVQTSAPIAVRPPAIPPVTFHFAVFRTYDLSCNNFPVPAMWTVHGSTALTRCTYALRPLDMLPSVRHVDYPAHQIILLVIYRRPLHMTSPDTVVEKRALIIGSPCAPCAHTHSRTHIHTYMHTRPAAFGVAWRSGARLPSCMRVHVCVCVTVAHRASGGGGRWWRRGEAPT